MKVGFVFLDGFDILTAVQKLRQVVAEIVEKEVNNGNFKQERYTLNLTFNDLLNGTWSIEWFTKSGDAENSKRFRLIWYYALDDESAQQRYNDGNLAHKYIAEYYILYKEDENVKKEEPKVDVVETTTNTEEEKK